jgi:hypothetical protein
MAMKIMPSYGLFVCRKDADLHALRSLGRAYITAPTTGFVPDRIMLAYHALRRQVLRLFCGAPHDA